MPNRGVAPLDPTSPVGEFRNAYGDTQYVPLDPPEVGYGDYTELSDDEIEMFLGLGEGSIPRAISIYFVRLAGDAAKVGRNIKDHDLAIDNRQLYEGFLATARYWSDLADDEGADFFVIAPTAFPATGTSRCECRPELAAGCVRCTGAYVF